MLILRPRRLTGTAFGAVLVATFALGAVALGAKVLGEPAGLASFIGTVLAAALLGLALYFGYWTLGCWSLRYYLDRNALSIVWAGNRHDIPLKEIARLVPGGDEAVPRVGGLWWPGYRIGPGALPGSALPSPVLFFTTHRTRRDLTYVVTPQRTYAISVPDACALAEEIKLRVRIGPMAVQTPGESRLPLWELPAWHDRAVVGLMAAALVMNVALFAFHALSMPALPVLLPSVGLALLAANCLLGALLYRVEPLAAYLCLAGGIAVQAVLWAASVRLLG